MSSATPRTAPSASRYSTITRPSSSGAVFARGISRCVTAGTTAADQPAYATTPGAEAPAFTAAIDEPRATDGWFDGGVLTWETGDNARPGDRGDAPLAAGRRASSRCGRPLPRHRACGSAHGGSAVKLTG